MKRPLSPKKKEETFLKSWIFLGFMATAAAMGGVLYLNLNLNILKTDLNELQAQIAKLEAEVNLILTEEEIEEAKDIMESEKDILLDLNSISANQYKDGGDALQFQHREQSRSKRSLVETRDDALLLPGESNEGHKIRHRNKKHTRGHEGHKGHEGHEGHKPRDSVHAMHFTLDNDIPTYHGCGSNEDGTLKYEGLSVACNVTSFPLWKAQDDHNLTVGALSDDSSKLIVAQEGLYHVYAQITFADPLLNAVFRVYRETDGPLPRDSETDAPLPRDSEKNVLTECVGREPFATNRHQDAAPRRNATYALFNQCFTERAVHLQAGDSIYVMNVRNTSIVRTEPHLTFWGIFMLNDDAASNRLI